MTTVTDVTSPSAAASAEPTSGLTAENTAHVAEVDRALREIHAFGEGDDGYDCAKAMVTSLLLGVTNPDKVAVAASLNRDKVRLWFKNLRENQVLIAERGHRKPMTWHVQWFDEDQGTVALILDVMVAQGLLARQVDPSSSET